jgi:hydroxylaminobenzene mutase
LRQSQWLLQTGLVLILYSSVEGFAIPYLGSPRIGLSVHTLSAFQGVFLLAQGLLWPRLKLSRTASWVAFWCSLHGTIAILAAYTIAAISGVGNETIMLMGELPHGLCPRQRIPGDVHQSYRVLIGANRSDIVCADALGPSQAGLRGIRGRLSVH